METIWKVVIITILTITIIIFLTWLTTKIWGCYNAQEQLKQVEEQLKQAQDFIKNLPKK